MLRGVINKKSIKKGGGEDVDNLWPASRGAALLLTLFLTATCTLCFNVWCFNASMSFSLSFTARFALGSVMCAAIMKLSAACVALGLFNNFDTWRHRWQCRGLWTWDDLLLTRYYLLQGVFCFCSEITPTLDNNMILPVDRLPRRRKKVKAKKPGSRGGIINQLRNRGSHHRLLTITLSNVRSLNNKLEEVTLCVKYEEEFRCSNLIFLTLTWLHSSTLGSDYKHNGFRTWGLSLLFYDFSLVC